MTNVPEQCVRKHVDLEFSVSENKSAVIFDNPNGRQIEQIQVDGCLFGDGDSKKCDWLINVRYTRKSIFVELKGNNVEDAFEQLKGATEKLNDILLEDIVWIICHTDNPRFDSTKQVLELKIRRSGKARPFINPTPYRHTI